MIEDFWSKVEKTDTCWLWTKRDGDRPANGWYGQWDGKMAHRVAYETAKGPIPEGLTLDHLCRNRACVNPDHLEPVTIVENVMRGESPFARNARKDECENGHPFDEQNTYRPPNRPGQRSCRECGRRRWREWRARKLVTNG